MSANLTREDALQLQECVARGGVAVFPSDTVYGVCCDPDDHGAARRMYELKGRPAARSCAVMFFSLAGALEQLEGLTEPERLALEVLLPGPLTLLLANRSEHFGRPAETTPPRSVCVYRGCPRPWPHSARPRARSCSRAPTAPASPTRAASQDVPRELREGRSPRARRRRSPGNARRPSWTCAPSHQRALSSARGALRESRQRCSRALPLVGCRGAAAPCGEGGEGGG